MTVIGIVNFSEIFGIKNLPFDHVYIECIDTVTKQKVVFEHPSNFKSKNKHRVVNRVIVGKTSKSLEYIQNNISKPKFYFPLINDCRRHTLQVCSIAEFPNYNNIQKSIVRAKFKN